MSRSYRKPYAAITGAMRYGSGNDKLVARRCWRRLQNRVLRATKDFDFFLNPHKYEASFNDTWGWGRDGNQTLKFKPRFEDQMHWFHCHYFLDEEAMQYAIEGFEKEKEWYARIQRK